MSQDRFRSVDEGNTRRRRGGLKYSTLPLRTVRPNNDDK
jgi:hypothetical protein